MHSREIGRDFIDHLLRRRGRGNGSDAEVLKERAPADGHFAALRS